MKATMFVAAPLAAFSIGLALLAGVGPAAATSSDLYNNESVAPSACHVLSGSATFTTRGYISNESTTTLLVVDCPIPYVVENSSGSVEFHAFVKSNGAFVGGPTLMCTFSLEDTGNEMHHSMADSVTAVGKFYLAVTLASYGQSTLSPARARCQIPPKNANGAAWIAGFHTYGQT